MCQPEKDRILDHFNFFFLSKDVGDFGACFLSCMTWNWKEAIKWTESLFFRRNFGMFG
jgi:hypothetical protein